MDSLSQQESQQRGTSAEALSPPPRSCMVSKWAESERDLGSSTAGLAGAAVKVTNGSPTP